MAGAGHVGSRAQLACLDRVRPRACVFGHVHEDRGAWTHGTTRLVNAAAVDVERRPRPDPAVVPDLA